MRADKQEYACQVLNISAGGVALLAPAAGEFGEHIVIYLEGLGRFEGTVVRHFRRGFAVKLAGSAYKREKVVDRLTWLLNRDKLDIADDRAHERFTPAKRQIALTLADGSQRQARILDVSLGGASVHVLPKPAVGESVALGLIRGSVVRHHEHGIGIRFREIQDPTTIERQFG
jgi:hypothetical protein